MLNDDYYQMLGLDRETLKASGAKSAVNNVFRGKFTPPFPMVEEEFSAAVFTYASLTDDSISLIGRSPPTDPFVQFTFVLPRLITDGRHELTQNPAGPRGVFVSGSIIKAHKGSVTFERNDSQKTIEGKFDMNLRSDDVDYHLSGTFFLNATGPL